jgi:hypothetical protein
LLDKSKAVSRCACHRTPKVEQIRNAATVIIVSIRYRLCGPSALQR